MLDWLVGIDKNLFFLINGAHNDTFDFIMWWISKTIIWLPLYALIAFLIIKRYKQDGIYLVLFSVILITLSDQSSVHLFKNIFQRFRPCHNPDFEGIVHIVNNKCGGKFGFVSSHAANTFAIASYVFFILRKCNFKFTIFLFFWASLVSYSRVYLGVHYPADVFGGAILGIICGFLTFKLFKLFYKMCFKKAFQ